MEQRQDNDVASGSNSDVSSVVSLTSSVGNSIGLRMISHERLRQMEKEGWSKEHDKKHSDMELAGAAGCYVANAINKHYAEDIKDWHEKARFQYYQEPESNFFVNSGDRGDRRINRGGWRDGFPFDEKYDKRSKHDKIRSLVIAGALIAAELDKLNQGKNVEVSDTTDAQLENRTSATKNTSTESTQPKNPDSEEQLYRGWISVEDRLPECNKKWKESEYMLLYDEWDRTTTGWYNKATERWHLIVGSDVDFKPTHWMPLPAPPNSLTNQNK